MDWRKLKHAVMLAEEGNFARAARRLNLTQPALSRSIQSLEASVGMSLFDRGKGGVRPTAAGRWIVERSAAILEMEASLERQAKAISLGQAGRVVMGLGPMLVPVLGHVLDAAYPKGSELNLRIEIEAVQTLAILLAAEKIDFFIADTSHARQFSAFNVTPLAEVPAGYYARAGHPLDGKPNLTLADLALYPLASPDLGSQPTAGVQAGSGGLTCEDLATLKRFSLRSDAVLLAMGFALEPELSNGQFVRLTAQATNDGLSHVGVVENAGRIRSPAAQRLIFAFKNTLDEGPRIPANEVR